MSQVVSPPLVSLSRLFVCQLCQKKTNGNYWIDLELDILVLRSRVSTLIFRPNMPSLIASSKGFKGSLMFLSNRKRTTAMILPGLKIEHIIGPIYMGVGDPRWVR